MDTSLGSEDFSWNSKEFGDFVEKLKKKFDIREIYTELTGEAFSNVNGRERARIAWRQDKNPSLTYVEGKNLLTDFTDHVAGSTKAGKTYNVFDILQKCGRAYNLMHAISVASGLAGEPVPLELQTQTEFQGLPFNTGQELAKVWESCQECMKAAVNDPLKRSVALNKFFSKRNIAFNQEFINVINVGLAPSYDEVLASLSEAKLLKKGKGGKDLNIFKPQMGENSIVFPLYNLNGALCGLKFRQLDEKNFSEWLPFGNRSKCYYNANRFKNMRIDKPVYLVEGEINLIAYAKALYDHAQKTAEGADLVAKMDRLLSNIFSTGSKAGSVSLFEGSLTHVIYVQDNDIGSIDENTSPNEHAVLVTCAKVANEIKSDDIMIVDWASLPYAGDKFDLEDYFRHHEYKLESLAHLPLMSIPSHAISVIENFCTSVVSDENRSKVRRKYLAGMAEMLPYADREILSDLGEKKYGIKVTEEIEQQRYAADARVGPYSIDALGQIIARKKDDNDEWVTKAVTNFYLRSTFEVTYFTANTKEKFYNIEIVRDGKVVGSDSVTSDVYIDSEKIKDFCSKTTSWNDLKCYDPALNNYHTILALMSSIPIRDRRYVFSSPGRPQQEFVGHFLKTELFCLMPNYSVINGKIIENKEIFIDMSGAAAASDKPVDRQFAFEFTCLDAEDYKKGARLFWEDLRNVHDTNLTDTLISVVFESCTRDVQGSGVVDNSHGFPIYLAGQSGSYKTTSAIAAMSLLGKFSDQNDLLQWHGTGLSVEHKLITTGTLTHCLDDLKIEDVTSKEFTNFFHMIYGGSTRTRMNSSADVMRGGKKINCSVIITAEAEGFSMPESIAARMLVLRVLRCNDAEKTRRKAHLDRIREKHHEGSVNLDLMRGVMPRMVAWCQQRGMLHYSASLERWKTYYAKVLDGHQNNTERPSDMIARIMAAFEQICEWAKFENLAPTEQIDARLNEFVDFWRAQAKHQIHRIEKQTSANKAVDMLHQAIQAGIIGMKVYSNGKWQDSVRNYQSYPIKDITYPDHGRKLIIVSPTILLNILNAQVGDGALKFVHTKFMDDLKEAGLIDMNEGKMVYYPVPNDRNGFINPDKLDPFPAIDYAKMAQLYKEQQR